MIGWTQRPFPDAAYAEKMLALRQQELEALKQGRAGPRTYEVNINADPAKMLNWDKPLAEQPYILDVLKDRGYKPAPWPYGDRIMQEGPSGSILDLKDSGADVYKAMGRVPNPYGATYDKQMASQALFESGVPGIQYLDAGSRPGPARFGGLFPPPSETPTHNYVMFPGTEDMVDIVKKYGVVGAPAGTLGMGGLAAQDQYQPQPAEPPQ